MEDIAAIIVSALCGIVGLLALLCNKNIRERAVLKELFLVAFVVRLLFTFVFYKAGLNSIVGGADDLGWAGMWYRSRSWETSGPDPILSLYDFDKIGANPGYAYFGTLFYYILGIESQMALACLNGFLNALTVVLIFKVSRDFFSEKSALFAARAAIFLPMFLIWSALTIKETWLIFLEVATFYAVSQLSRWRSISHTAIYAGVSALLILFILPLRFYVAQFLVIGSFVSLTAWHSRNPLRAAIFSVSAAILVISALNAVGIVDFNLVSLTETRLQEIATFRRNISDPNQVGTESAVILGYDTNTVSGAFLTIIIGTCYVLLSPFPWQITSLRQLITLPDVIMWWWLVFAFVLPGARHAWRQRPQLLLSVMAFVLPLLLFYSMMFANVGLAYRQRAQLMPFFFILVAAGYDWKQRGKPRLAGEPGGVRRRSATQQRDHVRSGAPIPTAPSLPIASASGALPIS